MIVFYSTYKNTLKKTQLCLQISPIIKKLQSKYSIFTIIRISPPPKTPNALYWVSSVISSFTEPDLRLLQVLKQPFWTASRISPKRSTTFYMPVALKTAVYRYAVSQQPQLLQCWDASSLPCSAFSSATQWKQNSSLMLEQSEEKNVTWHGTCLSSPYLTVASSVAFSSVFRLFMGLHGRQYLCSAWLC